MSDAKTKGQLARGLLRLAASPGHSLPESAFLAACGSKAPRGPLRRALGPLVTSGSVERAVRGKGARLTIPPPAVHTVLTWAREHLSDRTRVSGKDAVYLLGLATSGQSVAAPTEAAAVEPTAGSAAGPADEANAAGLQEALLSALSRLGAQAAFGGMVKIPDLVRAMGRTARELEPTLRKLARERRVQLDPLTDPLGVSAEERALGIPDPIRGLLFYVSPTRRDWGVGRR